MKTKTILAFLLFLGVPLLPTPAQTEVGTAFTYQGYLKKEGNVLNGDADFRFELHDALTGGNQVGPMVQVNGIEVSEGVFTVSLDFGGEVFDGSARWLEIAVRSPAGAGAFSLLAPRQPLTASPYSLQTRGIFVNDAANRWGFGTTAPKRGLHNTRDYYGMGHVYLHAYEGDGSSGTAYLQARDTSGTSSIGMQLRTQQTGTIRDVMYLASGGNVGVGRRPQNPHGFSRVLNVHGDRSAALVLSAQNGAASDDSWSLGMCSDGTLCVFHRGDAIGKFSVPILEIRGGSDIAEPFDVTPNSSVSGRESSPAEPGMVVAIDPRNPGDLRIAREPYDPTVAGIISGAGGVNTGMILSQKETIADGEHPVALTGRVWTYCDADANGLIRPGDLLTTSATAGHAMKATDRERAFGSVLGKAMTRLESGKGLVLVLVSLQ